VGKAITHKSEQISAIPPKTEGFGDASDLLRHSAAFFISFKQWSGRDFQVRRDRDTPESANNWQRALV